MESIIERITGLFNIPGMGAIGGFLSALLLLIVFWIVARILRGVTRRILKSSNVDNRISGAIGSNAFSLEKILPTVVFWFIMLFGIVGFLRAVDIPGVTEPIENLLSSITGKFPDIFGALILGAIAFVLATVVKTVVTKGAESLQIEQRLNKMEDAVDGDDYDGAAQQSSIAPALGTGLFWLIILMFLPGILGKLGMSELVTPLQNMLDQLLGFLPNILSAAIIGVIGYFVAKILRQVITGLLGATGVDKFSARAGLNMSLSALIGQLVFAVVLLLVIVQALDALKIEAISGPATAMIGQIFDVFPKLIGAGLVLGIAYFVGKIVAGLVTGLLDGIGFNEMPAKMGLNLSTTRPISSWVGTIIIAGFMLLASLAAVDMIGFSQLTGIVETFVQFAGDILMGVIVLGIGLWLANMVYKFATEAGISTFWAQIIRAAVMALIGAMALQAIGIGSNIVELAFGIALGAIGIAAALAFGLGSREIAGREMEKFVSSVNDDASGD